MARSVPALLINKHKKGRTMEKALSTGVTGFFSREYGKMVNFIRKRLNDSSYRDAEDIVQDVMVKIFESADINVPLEKLSAYIYTSLRNKIVDSIRARKGALALDEISEKEEFSLTKMVAGADKDLENREFTGVLYEAIESLGEDEREIVVLTEFEDISFRELSEEWGEPIGTLLSRKARAMEKIRETLKKGGV
jgi:RNA polymerase sigma factor (sigma-70 family)